MYNICACTLTSTPSYEFWPTTLSNSTDSLVLTRYPLKPLGQAGETIMLLKDIPIDPALIESTTDPALLESTTDPALLESTTDLALTSLDQDDSIRFTPSEEAVGPPKSLFPWLPTLIN